VLAVELRDQFVELPADRTAHDMPEGNDGLVFAMTIKQEGCYQECE
jgi:hypothetical protein